MKYTYFIIVLLALMLSSCSISIIEEIESKWKPYKSISMFEEFNYDNTTDNTSDLLDVISRHFNYTIDDLWYPPNTLIEKTNVDCKGYSIFTIACLYNKNKNNKCNLIVSETHAVVELNGYVYETCTTCKRGFMMPYKLYCENHNFVETERISFEYIQSYIEFQNTIPASH